MAATHTHPGHKSDKIWRSALTKAVKRRVNGKGSPQQLERIANAVVAEAVDGNIMAAKEIGDRLDGKPAQALDVAMAVAITTIERRIVDPIVLEAITVKAIEHDSEGE